MYTRAAELTAIFCPHAFSKKWCQQRILYRKPSGGVEHVTFVDKCVDDGLGNVTKMLLGDVDYFHPSLLTSRRRACHNQSSNSDCRLILVAPQVLSALRGIIWLLLREIKRLPRVVRTRMLSTVVFLATQ
jgi:hypothetical protein